MKRTTSQWRSVSSAMPFSAAIAAAICSFHCSGCVKKPSASTSTGASAIRVIVMSLLLSSGVGRGHSLAGSRHRRAKARKIAPRQECVPVDRLEQQLAEVIEPGFAEQRQPDRGREVTGQRLGLVVEVDQQRFVEAGLDEAVGMPVEAGLELLVREVAGDVL